ncbi:MAG: hypothetical protein Q8S84_00580 [bacterium]|nr:hypothetical protein [bacterium]
MYGELDIFLYHFISNCSFPNKSYISSTGYTTEFSHISANICIVLVLESVYISGLVKSFFSSAISSSFTFSHLVFVKYIFFKNAISQVSVLLNHTSIFDASIFLSFERTNDTCKLLYIHQRV